MSLFFFTFVFLLLVHTLLAYYSPVSIKYGHILSLKSTKKDDNFQRWSNPLYDERELNKDYISLGRSLMTIGSSGVSATHINSIVNLLSQHEKVRIKLASDKLDPHSISKIFIDDDILGSKAELLEVRKRGIMFGRKK